MTAHRVVRGGTTALLRGLGMRCPSCGARNLFRSYYDLRERCGGCGLRFEREEGYWLGAMVVAIGVTEGLFAIWFVGGLLLTWPTVAWGVLLAGGIALNLIVPVLGYPWAKTAWMGIHHAFAPVDAVEQADAITAREAARRGDG